MAGEDSAVDLKGSDVDGTPTNYIASLPMQVKQRIKALKKLQLDYIKINGDFYREAAELEKKYYAKYNEVHAKRAAIVAGSHEPSAEECEYKEPNEELATELAKVTIDDKNVSGIPSFWLTSMKSAVDGISEYIAEKDEPLLEHLADIVVEDNVDTFKLHFHFTPNDYFSNNVLTVEFKLQLQPLEDDPFTFDGPEIVATKGTTIDWKSEDKNVTQKKVTKKQKSKKTGTTRTVTKTVRTDSFFHFFSSPEWIEEKEDMDEEQTELFNTAVTIGSFIRERLVPRAVLYFTGEASGYDEDADEMCEDESDEVDEDADPEDDPDFKPTKKALRKAGPAGQECKQQ